MRAEVLTDAAFVKRAGRFVWLEVDTERPGSAAFLERYPVEVWPTFLVVDPRSETAVLKWLGSARAPDLARLLDDGERAVRGGGGETAEALLARGDRLHAEGRLSEAAAAWREALARGGEAWDRRPRVVESLVLALQAGGEGEACAALARAEAPRLPRGASFANAVAVGLSCALSAPEEAAWRAAARDALEPLGREAVGLPGLLADDRAGLHEALVAVRAERGDRAGARRLAEDWWRFLEAERGRARTAEGRAALDSWRVACALELGDPARAVPALRDSERALPRDYNPPYRLAALYLEMGRTAEALAASGRALERVYGPRRVRVLEQRASILERRGDRAGARAALEEAVAFAGTLPAALRPDRALSRVAERLAAMGRE